MKLLITGGINLDGQSYIAGDEIEVDTAKAKEYLQFPKVTIAPEKSESVETKEAEPKKKAKK